MRLVTLARPWWLRVQIDCGMALSAPSPSTGVESEAAAAPMQVDVDLPTATRLGQAAPHPVPSQSIAMDT